MLVPEDYTHAVIKAVGLVILAADSNDVQVVLTVFKDGVSKGFNIIKQYRSH